MNNLPDQPRSPLPLDLDAPSLTGARADLVNRTHRVVRERAEHLRQERSRSRSLLAPMLVCAFFLIILCSAVWSLLNQYQDTYEHTVTHIPDASGQFFIFLLWFLPVSAAMLALALLRRVRADREGLR